MSLVAERRSPSQEIREPFRTPRHGRESITTWAYAGVVVVGLLLLDVFGGLAYTTATTLLVLAVFLLLYAKGDRAQRRSFIHYTVDRRDLLVLAVVYAVVVAFFRIAFTVIENNDGLLFISFAAGLLVGVIAPVTYTVWARKRPLATLGLSLADLPRTLTFAVLFAAVQFSITLWGYDLPTARTWITLLGMALMVGVFESIFFRGFVQGRLQASLGAGPAVFGAALLYGLYHVGYGMELEEMVLLIGLGVIYGLAYLTVENLLVLWPLLTPLGSFFAQLEGGELANRLPWAALLGFADVIAVMAAVIWFAHRRERKGQRHARLREA